ncbi:peptidoglycan-binding protein [Streptomyces violascens]|uniref:peptidoglycan-binding protein n=1 Tax=Streptomyces violascens TaxID=67381 RepID=UPI0036C94DB4
MKPSAPGPVFEDYEPAGECGCPGCADRRRLRLLPVRDGGHPAASGGARRALVAATAASVVIGGSGAAAAVPVPLPGGTGANMAADPGPPTEQGGPSGLHGAPGKPAHGPVKLRPISRAEIINRAKTWVAASVPYNMDAYWTDGYRQDCSGYVSMAWNLGTNEWTGSLDQFAVRTTRNALQPGDILLFHNPSNPNKGSHVVIFGGWTDHTHNYYTAYEQTPPGTRKQATPYAYWKNSAKYVPFRYKSLAAGGGGGATVAETGTQTGTELQSLAFPGAAKFGPGADNSYVTRLGQMLVLRGGSRFYSEGPGPRWTSSDLNATRAFQEAQGWSGAEADGIPGPQTWALLVQGGGKDIAPAEGQAPAKPQAPANPPASVPAPVPLPAKPEVPAKSEVPAKLEVPAKSEVPATPPAPAQDPVSVPAQVPSPAQAAVPAPVAVPVPVPVPAQASTPAPAQASNTAPAEASALVPAPVTASAQGGSQAMRPAYPGKRYFRPGQDSPYVTQLGRQLVKKGFGRYYTEGPGSRWSEEDRRNVEAFQRAQGWSGAEADGYPGPETWRRLFA